MRRVLPPMITYAQNFEDVLLRRALSEIERGFYIDVGAFHPVVDNVTYWFYCQGWSGINVEPNPRFHTLLREQRPHDLNLAVAVAGEPGELELHLLDGLSTTVGTVAAQHARTGHTSEGTTRVEALSLSDLFARYVDKREVDFLKIDVEGAESAILEACPFDAVRPRLIVIEATEPDSVALTSAAWEGGLLSKGYEFCYFDGLNRYFVRTEDAWRKTLFDAPPNVFDQFRLPFADRRVDYVASARAAPDQVPEGGIPALIGDRDSWAARARTHLSERDALAIALRSEQVGRDTALRAERAAFALELAALTREHVTDVTALTKEHVANVAVLTDDHADALASLTSQLIALKAKLHDVETQCADYESQLRVLMTAQDVSLLQNARLQIKLDALRMVSKGKPLLRT